MSEPAHRASSDSANITARRDFETKTVGVIGLGAMGSRIAGRLLDVGHNVVVWNRTPSKANALVGRGAAPVGSPAEAAARVDYLITMIANPEALRAVYTRDHGVLAGLASTTSVIEMSTVGPSSIEWLRSLLPLDIALLDAPVLGSIAQAEAGALTLFVGGPEAAVTKATPLLASLGSIITQAPSEQARRPSSSRTRVSL